MMDYKDLIPSRLEEMKVSTAALQFELTRRALARRATLINQLEHTLGHLRQKNHRTAQEARRCWDQMTVVERATAERNACLSFLIS